MPAGIPIQAAAIPVEPDRSDEDVLQAQKAATWVGKAVIVKGAGGRWKFLAAKVRSWITFTAGPGGTLQPVIDKPAVPKALRTTKKDVARTPVSAQYLRSRSGRSSGSLPGTTAESSTRRQLPLRSSRSGTTRGWRDTEDRQGCDRPPGAEADNRGGHEEGAAHDAARLMADVLPDQRAQLLRRQHLAARADHQRDRAQAGPALRVVERPGPGDHGARVRPRWRSSPATTRIRQARWAAGCARLRRRCSSNAALRAGLTIGARDNHRYYISRYPLGLDATVSNASPSCRSRTT